MCKITSRFEEISKQEGITIGALEKKIGASKGVLSRAIAKGTDIQAKWIESVVENYPQYSAEWLLTGKGSMLQPRWSVMTSKWGSLIMMSTSSGGSVKYTTRKFHCRIATSLCQVSTGHIYGVMLQDIPWSHRSATATL